MGYSVLVWVPKLALLLTMVYSAPPNDKTNKVQKRGAIPLPSLYGVPGNLAVPLQNYPQDLSSISLTYPQISESGDYQPLNYHPQQPTGFSLQIPEQQSYNNIIESQQPYNSNIEIQQSYNDVVETQQPLKTSQQYGAQQQSSGDGSASFIYKIGLMKYTDIFKRPTRALMDYMENSALGKLFSVNTYKAALKSSPTGW